MSLTALSREIPRLLPRNDGFWGLCTGPVDPPRIKVPQLDLLLKIKDVI